MIRKDGRVVNYRPPKGSHGWSKLRRRQEQWAVKAIIDEDPAGRRYLVDWEGIDPDTGRPWLPTWEPYSYLYHAKETRLAWDTRKALLDEWQDMPSPAPSRQAAAAAVRAAAEALENIGPQAKPMVIDEDDEHTDSDDTCSSNSDSPSPMRPRVHGWSIAASPTPDRTRNTFDDEHHNISSGFHELEDTTMSDDADDADSDGDVLICAEDIGPLRKPDRWVEEPDNEKPAWLHDPELVMVRRLFEGVVPFDGTALPEFATSDRG